MTPRGENISAHLRDALLERSRQLLARAAARYGTPMPEVTVRFDVGGAAAGTAYPTKAEIRLNAALLAQDPERFLHEVVGHEIAHIVAYRVHGPTIRPHGAEWAAVMRLFGLQPRRCHDFDLSQVQLRRQRRYPYHCACSEHALSATRHNRARRGTQSYLCRRCGEALVEAMER